MGAFSFSIDSKFLKGLIEAGNFDNFVETGTFHGDTAQLASKHFKKVWTIEASAELYSKAEERFRDTSNVVTYHSDSPNSLRQIYKQPLAGNTLFWLDAHWCSAEATEGASSQCPLLEELDAISCLKPDDVILIDDARLYLSKPQPPHESADWPNLTEILNGIRCLTEVHEIRIINDVIVVFPLGLRNAVDSYSDKYGNDLMDLIWKAKEYDTIAEKHVQHGKTLMGKLKKQIKKFF